MFICECVIDVYSLSHAPLFATLRTVACQAPLSMGFSRQEYWSRLPFPSPGDLPNPGIEPTSLALAGGFFTTGPSGKSVCMCVCCVCVFMCVYICVCLGGFPGGSDNKESACNAGDLESVPRLEDPLEKGMATHSSILAWRIPRTEEPDGLQSMDHKVLDTTERLILSLHFHMGVFTCVCICVYGGEAQIPIFQQDCAKTPGSPGVLTMAAQQPSTHSRLVLARDS